MSSMISSFMCTAVAGLLLAAAAPSAQAHEGHDHSEEAAVEPAVQTSPEDASRLVLESPQVELVAVREAAALVIYIDDHASNAPLAGLHVQAALGSHVLEAAELAPGTYRIPDDLLDAAAVSATRIRFLLHGPALDETLEGPLPSAPPETAVTTKGSGLSFPVIAVAAVSATILLAVAARLSARRRRRRLTIA